MTCRPTSIQLVCDLIASVGDQKRGIVGCFVPDAHLKVSLLSNHIAEALVLPHPSQGRQCTFSTHSEEDGTAQYPIIIESNTNLELRSREKTLSNVEYGILPKIATMADILLSTEVVNALQPQSWPIDLQACATEQPLQDCRACGIQSENLIWHAKCSPFPFHNECLHQQWLHSDAPKAEQLLVSHRNCPNCGLPMTLPWKSLARKMIPQKAVASELGPGYQVLTACSPAPHFNEETQTSIIIKTPLGSMEKVFLRQRMGKDALMKSQGEFESLLTISATRRSLDLAPIPRGLGRYEDKEGTVFFNVNEWVECVDADPFQRAMTLLEFHRSTLGGKRGFGFSYPTYLKNRVQTVQWQKVWADLLKNLVNDAVSVHTERYGPWKDSAWFRSTFHNLVDFLIGSLTFKPVLTLGNVHNNLGEVRFLNPGVLYAPLEWEWCFLWDYPRDLTEQQAAEIRQRVLEFADEPKSQCGDRAQLYQAAKLLRDEDVSRRTQ